MKAKRRHELQTNALADWLSKKIALVQPHTNTILVGVLLAVVVVAAVMYLSGRSSKNSAVAWSDYCDAMATDDIDTRISNLSGVVERHPNTPAGLWAQLNVAESRLQRGAEASLADREAGQEDLDEAKLDFKAVIEEGEKFPASQSQWLLQCAHWGLAQTYDALAEGERAIDEYEQLATTWPDSAYGEEAARRARNLRSMGDWFDWYANVDPKSFKPTAMEVRPPAGAAFGEGPFPGASDFDLPGPLDLGTGDLGTGSDFGTDFDPLGGIPSGTNDTPSKDGGADSGAPTGDKPTGDNPTGDASTGGDASGAAETTSPGEGGAQDGAPSTDVPPAGNGTSDGVAPKGTAGDDDASGQTDAAAPEQP